MSTTDDRDTETVYQEVQRTAAFADLRSRLRRFVFPMSAAFLLWYLAYVVLASYAPEFMATRIGGSNITIGLVFGLLQFVTTFAITAIYVRYADRRLDPAAKALREQVEAKQAEVDR
jgi:uncharacterized membrane protein (DUF485 family)